MAKETPRKGNEREKLSFSDMWARKLLDSVAKTLYFFPFILCYPALPTPAQVQIQRLHWKGYQFSFAPKRNYILLCQNIGSGVGK